MSRLPLIDYNRVFARVPDIMHLELTLRGKAWEGRYYMTGEPHYKRDKLKVRLNRGAIRVYEQGGGNMSIVEWLVEYGGCATYRDAFDVLRGNDAPVPDFTFVRRLRDTKYVPNADMEAMRVYTLGRCPLFVWMAGIFGEERVREVWMRYNVTTDESGLAVYWYVDVQGRVLFDKRMRYCADGHRDKAYGGGRRYRVGDGYDGRCYFGEHLTQGVKDVFVCESEKDALLFALCTDKVAVATGGKSNLRDVKSNMVLLPDVDAADEWEAKKGDGKVCRWWEHYPCHGDHDGVGDYVLWRELVRRARLSRVEK